MGTRLHPRRDDRQRPSMVGGFPRRQGLQRFFGGPHDAIRHAPCLGRSLRAPHEDFLPTARASSFVGRDQGGSARHGHILPERQRGGDVGMGRTPREEVGAENGQARDAVCARVTPPFRGDVFRVVLLRYLRLVLLIRVVLLIWLVVFRVRFDFVGVGVECYTDHAACSSAGVSYCFKGAQSSGPGIADCRGPESLYPPIAF